MSTDWDALLLAYLHDPPDKALAIQGHVDRACRYAKSTRDEPVESNQLKNRSDALASVAERFPAPHWSALKVDPAQDGLTINHPLSGRPRQLPIGSINEAWVVKQIQSIMDGLGDDRRRRFLALWRFLPEQLADAAHPWFASLPADTRTPDHTIWHHLDTTAGLQATEDTHGRAFLAFALGPVQRFIEAARSVRDLWSGSMILSWLAFRAMLPVVEQFGPTALVYPALRGIPLLDLWLRGGQQLGEKKVQLPSVELRLTPSLPHRFLALVPWGPDGATAQALAEQCQQAARKAVGCLADAVKKAIQGPLDRLCPGWDKRWDRQIEGYFSFATAAVPLAGSGEKVDGRLARLLMERGSFKEAFANAEAVRELARTIPRDNQPGYPQDHAGRWQYQVELVQRSLAAHRAVRHVPLIGSDATTGQRCPQKCTLLGSFEQMGPDDLRQSRDFWDRAVAQDGLSIDGVRVRQGEALCAVSLVKRFAGPAFLREQLQLSMDDLRFPDTWTIAAAEWLANAERYGHRLGPGHNPSWNGHWLHWSRPDQDLSDADPCPANVLGQIQDARKPEKCGAPPVYYAILKLDGDDLGGWLRGEKSPKVREVMHPDLVHYYESLGQATHAGLDAKRPVGPALHAAISTALANFALHVVPKVVEEHHGTVIYSGGDDTLVLLPVSQALACALALRGAYTRDYYTNGAHQYLMMGSRATLSSGIVIVHAKDDLRLALQDARATEHKAKESGKDALAITIRRRSGEHTSAVCPWSFVATVGEWTTAFQEEASDRWAYHLYADRRTLETLPMDAIKAEMRRQLKRAEEPTPRLIPPDKLAETFGKFRESTIETDGVSRPRFESTNVALNQFLTLCHTASFLARGRDT
ncbi:MAG: type III-B CRISPR-associated protein Cas10/Cmr2 [Gemmataceae bacterium]|nr:type III-B CRISPR-associated protein Cas10/Cmr2 [Gemmataceae bacterium]